MEAEQLKPCPICGEPPDVSDIYGPEVRCAPCGLDWRRLDDWNTRPVEDAIRAERDAAVERADGTERDRDTWAKHAIDYQCRFQQAERERDAAVRERDEALARVKHLEGHNGRMGSQLKHPDFNLKKRANLKLAAARNEIEQLRAERDSALAARDELARDLALQRECWNDTCKQLEEALACIARMNVESPAKKLSDYTEGYHAGAAKARDEEQAARIHAEKMLARLRSAPTPDTLAECEQNDRDSARERDEAIAEVWSELQDWRESAERAAGETCGDEKHCACVGPLRALVKQTAKARDEAREGAINAREPVRWFAERMEEQLCANDHKLGWQSDALEALLARIEDETTELWDAILDNDPARITKEAADVANFAMMIADNARRELSAPAPREEGGTV